ncbi:MAG TPA: hypothetical protein VGH72_26810 [Pseudonocardia sp.]|jgi:hypothetical protein
MTDQPRPGTATPVRTALFPDGPDSLLLNPDVPEWRWRRERVRAALRPRNVLFGLGGVGLTVLAVLTVAKGSVLAAMPVLGIEIVAFVACLLVGWRSATGVLADHRHGPARPCRFDRVRGEFFFRSRDVAGLGTAGDTVRTLIAGVDELHRSPARPWIDPAVPGEVHRVVWQALCCLDRTRAARSLTGELADDPDSAVGELAAAAREAVTVIDDALDEVVRHVHGCLVLTREWEAKLRRGDLAARTEGILAALPGEREVRQVAQAAEALPQRVFAYLTAARDLTGAGEFPWEQHPCTRARLLRVLPGGLRRGTAPRTALLRLVRSGEDPS